MSEDVVPAVPPQEEPIPAEPCPGRAGGERLGGFTIDHQIGFLLRRAYQRHTAAFQEWIGETDLTPMQFAALAKVVELGPVTQNALGRLVAMDPATIQGVVKRLCERGFISRCPDRTDKRSVIVAATQCGIEQAALAVAASAHITDAVLAPLDEAERRTMFTLLDKIGLTDARDGR